jgi:glycine cleavage system aminomethyltransferase T
VGGLAEHVGQVLVQCPAPSHVPQLRPPAHGQHRPVGGQGGPQQGHLPAVAITLGGVGLGVGGSAVPADRADLGRRVDVEVFGRWIGAEVVKDPVYDPEGARIRA